MVVEVVVVVTLGGVSVLCARRDGVGEGVRVWMESESRIKRLGAMRPRYALHIG